MVLKELEIDAEWASRKLDFGPRKAGTGTKLDKAAGACFNPNPPPLPEKGKDAHRSAARTVDMGAPTKPGTGTMVRKSPRAARVYNKETKPSEMAVGQETAYPVVMSSQFDNTGELYSNAFTPFPNITAGGKGKSVATEQFVGTLRYDQLVSSGKHLDATVQAQDPSSYSLQRSIHPVYASSADFFKANPHLKPGTGGRRPIAYKKDDDLLKDLQNGGKGSMTGPFGGQGHQRVVKSLEEQGEGSPYAKAVDAEGYTALHACAVNGYLELVKLLVEKGKVDISIKTKNGYTALDIATRRGWPDVAELLDEKTPDITENA